MSGQTAVVQGTGDAPAHPIPRTADLVLEGGGVKGIGLAGAVTTLAKQGYHFNRIGGTSAGAIVACLVAVYTAKGIDLDQIETDMRELDYLRFEDRSRIERDLGVLGTVEELFRHEGLYTTDYLVEWLGGKLEQYGVTTFGDLRLDDPGADANLPDERKYRLVVHASDLTRKCLVRLPWDLPHYLEKPEGEDGWRSAIDRYPLVDAVRASMSIPGFFQPFTQPTADGSCTWVDGGLLQNFPITCFDRTDGKKNRWPTFGIKLSGRPVTGPADRAVAGVVGEIRDILGTLLGPWNGYALDDEHVDLRTMFVDTSIVKATDFDITDHQKDTLFDNGVTAATSFVDRLAKANARARRTRRP